MLARGQIELNFNKSSKRKKRPAIVRGDLQHEEDSDMSSDADSDSDVEQHRMKKQLAEKKITRMADLFEAKDPSAGQLFVFVGKSERGKTHFIKWLLMDQLTREMNPLKWGIVFVRTKYRQAYKFVPDDKVYQGYDEQILKLYVRNLEAIYEEQGYIEPSFIVFDDLVGILNNRGQWFNNFIATFRQLNIHIFIAVQYLTGIHAVSPIMREQTNCAIMFNSKTTNTVKNLYENYGQLFETRKEFQQYLFENTEPSKVGPYVCIVYFEKEDRLEENYIPMRAPAQLPKMKLQF